MLTSKDIYKLDGYRCRAWGCGCGIGLEDHHIIPRSQGYYNEPWNRITLCHMHHSLVTENKITDIDLLTAIEYKRDFRWSKALEWHRSRQFSK